MLMGVSLGRIYNLGWFIFFLTQPTDPYFINLLHSVGVTSNQHQMRPWHLSGRDREVAPTERCRGLETLHKKEMQ